MTHKQIKTLINALISKGIQFDKGLSDDEVLQIEQTFDIQFVPDLKAFLQTKLPIDEYFVNWRLALHSDNESKNIQARLNSVFDGICFDIQYNDFWQKEWGDKPSDIKECFKIAKQHYQTYPKMIPIYSHRYIPSSPHEMGNPIFSIWGTDIIYYGNDLIHYFNQEFNLQLETDILKPNKPNRIEFWSDFVDYLDGNFNLDEPRISAIDESFFGSINEK